jgi:hypothetical protein
MTNIDVKTVGELSKFVGPTEEYRQEFGQPPSGSLLARAVVSVAVAVALALTLPFQIPANTSANDGRRDAAGQHPLIMKHSGTDRRSAQRTESNLQGGMQWPPNPSM